MMETILKVNSLTKKFGGFIAVNNVSFELEKGKIYGFIGQNGAGKTTIIRMLAGVSIPNGGTIELFGNSSRDGISEGRKKIGTIVESPALYTKMTARDNIEIQKCLYGIKNDNLANELLSLVGLQGWEDKKVKDFSLGMRQRLAIAMSLVNNPELLILDEPINGLDPMGIVEIRQLLQRLNNERKITILISSHILSELYQLATDYIIIDKGIIVDKLSNADLDVKCQKAVVLEVEDIETAEKVVVETLKSSNYEVIGNSLIKIYDYVNDIRSVAKAMMDNNVLVVYLNIVGKSLEEYFMEIIGGVHHV
ncbi:MAG: ABC transporter ATP-binding protein [Lachnospiraceae bacterium]|nr:ABC transporter ATP-binding protein [Lachnospiraceae bacterium]